MLLIRFHPHIGEGIINQIKLQYRNDTFNPDINKITIKIVWKKDRDEDIIKFSIPNVKKLIEGNVSSIDINKVKYHYN